MAELKARVENERAAGAYSDDLSDIELQKPGSEGGTPEILQGFELGAPGPRVQFRPELGFSSKPVVGPVITLIKRLLLRLQLYVLEDLARQADTAIRRLENALAVEIETRERLERELKAEIRASKRETARGNLLSHAAGLPDAVEVKTNAGELWSHRDDEITASMQEHGFWEMHMVRLLEKQLHPGMAFLDVGAHIGYFSVLASKLVGPMGHVVAVEPDPGSAALLRANLWRHGCANVTVLPIAAWDSFAYLGMTIRLGNRGGSWVTRNSDTDIRVPAAPLDGLLDERFDLIKVDAEGRDHLVLEGARRLLRTCPLAVVEFWPRGAPVSEPADPRQILAGYEAFGRELAVVSVMGELERITSQELLELEDAFVGLALKAEPG